MNKKASSVTEHVFYKYVAIPLELPLFKISGCLISWVSPGDWDKREETENTDAKFSPAHVHQNCTLSVS